MDSFQKIKQATREMIADEQRLLVDARRTNQSTQPQAEIYSRLEGMRMIYNAILEIEGKPAIK
jgi:hypothetical protein